MLDLSVFVQQIYRLAEKAGCPALTDWVGDHFRSLGDPAIHVLITGFNDPAFLHPPASFREKGLMLYPIPLPEIPAAGKPPSELPRADAVVFLIDSLMPLTRTDVHWLNHCVERELICLAGLARLAAVNEMERADVVQYVENYITQHWGVVSILSSDDLSFDTIGKMISERAAAIDIEAARTKRFMLQSIKTLFGIRDHILARQEDLNKGVDQVRQLESLERKRIGQLEDEWALLENKLIGRRQQIEKQMREHLAANREKVLASLEFELERSRDTKGFWERDLPYFLKREIQQTAERLSRVIGQRLTETVAWLSADIGRLFDLSPPFEASKEIGLAPVGFHTGELSLMDKDKWRVRSRYGAAVTVVGAGSLLLLGPAGGLLMATGIIYQALVEEHILATGKKEKEMVRQQLTRLVEATEAAYVVEFSKQLQKEIGQLLLWIRQQQEVWRRELNSHLALGVEREMSQLSNPGLSECLEQADQWLTQLSQYI